MMPSAIVHCAELERDLSPILARVPEAFVQTARRTPGTHAGCIEAHQAIVRRAMKRDWPAVFVMEDDCDFTDHFSWPQWLADVAWAQAEGYGVLAGGCISARRPQLVRAGLFAVERFKSTHCVVYLQAAYEVVLRLIEPMDVMLGRLGARCLMAYPFVALQAPTFSGIQNRPVDYRAKYRRFEQSLEALACAS